MRFNIFIKKKKKFIFIIRKFLNYIIYNITYNIRNI